MKEFIKNNWLKLLLILGLLIAVIFAYNKCKAENEAKKRLEVAEQNIVALNDTIKITKNRAGEDEANKFAFLIDDMKALKALNVELFNKVKNIKGTVTTIIDTKTKIVHDTTYLNASTSVVDSNITTNFNFDTTYSKGNSRSIVGFTNYSLKTKESRAVLSKDNLEIAFTAGVKKNKEGQAEAFITSNYPGFETIKLDGAVIDPKLYSTKTKQHLLSLSANVGWVPVTYSFGKQKAEIDATRIGIAVGVGINIQRLYQIIK